MHKNNILEKGASPSTDAQLNHLDPFNVMNSDKLVDLLNIINNSTNFNQENSQAYSNLINSLLSLVTTLYAPATLIQQQNSIKFLLW